MNGFKKHCPSGNGMIDGYEPKPPKTEGEQSTYDEYMDARDEERREREGER